ncbi:endoribonuclease Dcr-1 [Arctopsyche grandis]|uniref:endoribonuclease Dcr-1 n=1 Tax=Arctopsyche grandis TaxID=121162 RepID=UPI00406D8B7A
MAHHWSEGVSTLRFTSREFQQELVEEALIHNLLTCPPSSAATFVALKVIQELAYQIRRPSRKKTVVLAPIHRIKAIASELSHLSDLQATSLLSFDDSTNFLTIVNNNEILVCNSEILEHLFVNDFLNISILNLLVIEECHLITVDINLQKIISRYMKKKMNSDDQSDLPRILAFTHPLFTKCDSKKSSDIIRNARHVVDKYSEDMPMDRSKFIITKHELNKESEQSVKCLKNFTDLVCLDVDKDAIDMNSFQYWYTPCIELPSTELSSDDVSEDPNSEMITAIHDNNITSTPDRTIYDKLEYQLEKLEQMLCCEVDMASDIVGLKRITGKPREVIVECKELVEEEKIHDRQQLEKFMKSTIAGALIFLEDHRYDPTEIYEDEAFGEELRAIPDPRIEPREMLELFMFVLEEIGPYAADKAAFSLLIKIEKLKIKIPYERHFLLLCLVSSIFIQIRAAAELIFDKYSNEKEKILIFSTPKISRLFDILKLFKPSDLQKVIESPSKTVMVESNKLRANKSLGVNSVCKENNEINLNIPHSVPVGKNTKTHENIKNKGKEKNIPNSVSNSLIYLTDTELEKVELQLEPDDFNKCSTNNSMNNHISNIDNENKSLEKICSIELEKDFVSLCDQEKGDKTSSAKHRLSSESPLNFQNIEKNEDKQECINDKLFRNSQSDKIVKGNSKLHSALQGINDCNFKGLLCKIQHDCNKLLECDSQDDSKNNINHVKKSLDSGIEDEENLHYDNSTKTLSENSQNEIIRPSKHVTKANDKCDTSHKFTDLNKSEINIENNLKTQDKAAIYILKDNFKAGSKDSPSRKFGDNNFRGRGRGRGGKSYGFHSRYYHNANNDPDALCGLIFVNEPLIAKILSTIINEFCRSDDDLRFVCAQYTVDKVADPLTDPKEAETEHKLQEEVLKRFRIHECNLLVGTSILEEGMDLPKCNLVIRWDPPNGYRSHARCRARARAPRSLYALLVLPPSESSITMLSHFSYIERMLVRKCGWREPPASEEADAARFSSLIEPYRPATSAVHLSSAVALLNRYCVKLPSDTFTRLVPLWSMECVNFRGKPIYVCTIRLPINCPLKHHIVGHPMPNRVLARRVAALQACRALHKAGELDDNLMPIGKEGFRATESDWLSLPPPSDIPKSMQGDIKDLIRMDAFENSPQYDSLSNFEPRPGTTKRKQYYYKKVANAFSGCRPIVGELCLAYQVNAWLACPLPERHNTRGRKLHPPESYGEGFAILTAKSIQQIPVFPIFTRSGEVRVALQQLPFEVMISRRRKRLIHYFMKYTFAEVLRVHNHLMIFDESGKQNRNSYYIVPTLKVTDRDSSNTSVIIDWNFLQLIYDQTSSENMSMCGKTFFDIHLNCSRNNSKTGKCSDNSAINSNNNAAKKMVEEYANIVKMAMLNQSEIKDVVCKTTSTEEIVEKDEKKSKEPIELTNCKNTKDVEKSNGMNVTVNNVSKILNNSNIDDEKHLENNMTNVDDKNVILDEKNEINDSQEENISIKVENHVTESEINNAKENLCSNNDSEDIVQITNITNNEEILHNPYLSQGETYEFDSEKYRDAVVMPWYRNQDQPQYFYVAEICWHLSPCSNFPSDQHATFEEYYKHKYNVKITQSCQPLLDVDHTSARLNLLTPRFVNRKGVALPTSSERTKRAKRESLEQKQILVPELCCTHPFRGALWRAAVALPCILYRLNSLLLADEIRRSVALRVALGVSKLESNFKWPALDFGWSLAEVLAGENAKENKDKKDCEKNQIEAIKQNEECITDEKKEGDEEKISKKTANDILKEKEDADEGLNEDVFEIGTWSNDMASTVPQVDHEGQDYDEDELISATAKLPGNLTICTSIGGGADWSLSGNDPSPPLKVPNRIPQQRKYSMADSDKSYVSSEFDASEEGSNSSDSDSDDFNTNIDAIDATSEKGGLRIEFKSGNEAEAIEVPSTVGQKKIAEIIIDPEIQKEAEEKSLAVFQQFFYNHDNEDEDTIQHVEEFKKSIDLNKICLKNNGILIPHDSNLDHLKLQTSTDIGANREISVFSNNNKKFYDQSELNLFISSNNIPRMEVCVKNDKDKCNLVNEILVIPLNTDSEIVNENKYDNETKTIKETLKIEEQHTQDNTETEENKEENQNIEPDVHIDGNSLFDIKENNLNNDSTEMAIVQKKNINDNIEDNVNPFPESYETVLGKTELLKLYNEMFPFEIIPENAADWFNCGLFKNGCVTLSDLEKNKRKILNEIKNSMSFEEWTKFNFFSMKDLDEDDFGHDFLQKKNEDSKTGTSILQNITNGDPNNQSGQTFEDSKSVNNQCEVKDKSANFGFSFDLQPDLNNHPGPSPSLILQALTMSNANDGINLERLETIGDSFLKYAITTYLYCTYQNIHEGKLSHLRSKQVSNLNLYRLGRRKSLGSRMVAYKFEPHDNWLPPCHRVPPHLERALIDTNIPSSLWNIADMPPLAGLSKDEIEKLVRERVASYHATPANFFHTSDKSIKEDENCPLHGRNIKINNKPMISNCKSIDLIENNKQNGSIDSIGEKSIKNITASSNGTFCKCTCTVLMNNSKKLDNDKDLSLNDSKEGEYVELEGIPCFVPYNLITQHSIPDKSVADCVEALIGAYLIECGPRGALLFMAWLGIRVLPKEELTLSSSHPFVKMMEQTKVGRPRVTKEIVKSTTSDLMNGPIDEDDIPEDVIDKDDDLNSINDIELDPYDSQDENSDFEEDDSWNWEGRIPGSLKPEKNDKGIWTQIVYGELKPPPSPLLRYVPDPEGELMQMLSGYEGLERTLGYRFKDRCYLLQAMTHASYSPNRLTDCYQRLEFLGDAVLDYLITRQLYEDPRRHSPGALTDLRSALVNNTIFASLAVRHGMHKYFRHLSPGLNEVLARFVKIQEENGHSISEEHYLIQEDECEQAEDVEVPKALGDLFESVAGAIFLDSGMSLDAVWKVYHALMQREIEAFSESVPKSPVRELLEMEPETAKFGKPEKLADGRRVRVTVEVLGAGAFKGVGRNYRIAKCTAAKCALRKLAPSGTRRHNK